jgi:HEAT repeat protein
MRQAGGSGRPISADGMLNALLNALIQSPNEAADDLLLEALAVGNGVEQASALEALIARATTHGLGSVVDRYDELSDELKLSILDRIKLFHHALRECGRSDSTLRRLAAMRLITLGREGKLCYVLAENLHEADEQLGTAAVESIVGLAQWVSTTTHRIQRCGVAGEPAAAGEAAASNPDSADDGPIPMHEYTLLMEQRPEIEAAVARALDVHRGSHGTELVRAALLLCDNAESKTLGILKLSKHGGQASLVRRMQQPPSAEHVEAFFLGATHGQLRNNFGNAFAHIVEAPVLDAVLRKTHWLKDHQLQLCMHQVTRGTWWSDVELMRDIGRRPPEDAAKAGNWIAASGMHDVTQDDRLNSLRVHAAEHFGARLRLLRLAAGRKRGASVALLRHFLTDRDERLVRLAVREIIRRRPSDYENMLLQMMTNAPEGVRRLISRAIGKVGFEGYWQRFDKMDPNVRRQAGRAMLKLLPDALQRLARRLTTGPVEQRVKAIQIVQELSLAEMLRAELLPLCSHPNSHVRSKAVCTIGDMPNTSGDSVLEQALNDADPRVRANAIEVLERRAQHDYVAVLAQRARSTHNRERANAIKAMHHMRVGTATPALLEMLRDARAEHRISALWALRQMGVWQLLTEVGNLAKQDDNLRVRRYALGVLKGVADIFQKSKAG